MIAGPQKLPGSPALPPRRFAQGMAGSFMLAIGVCLLAGWLLAAWILQVFLVVALSTLIFGRFCLGSTSLSAPRQNRVRQPDSPVGAWLIRRLRGKEARNLKGVATQLLTLSGVEP